MYQPPDHPLRPYPSVLSFFGGAAMVKESYMVQAPTVADELDALRAEVARLRAALVEERALRYHLTRDMTNFGDGRANEQDRADALASLRFDGLLPPE